MTGQPVKDAAVQLEAPASGHAHGPKSPKGGKTANVNGGGSDKKVRVASTP